MDDDDITQDKTAEEIWAERKARAEKALAEADQEAAMLDLSINDLAKQKLINTSATAADQLIQIALTGTEAGRLRANTYILDRVFGKVDSEGFVNASDDPLKKLLGKLGAGEPANN